MSKSELDPTRKLILPETRTYVVAAQSHGIVEIKYLGSLDLKKQPASNNQPKTTPIPEENAKRDSKKRE